MTLEKKSAKAISYTLIAVILLASVFCFIIFGPFHSHESIEGECEICLAINFLRNVFESILVAACTVFLPNLIDFIWCSIKRNEPFSVCSDLISLKVKLSD